MTYVSLSIYSPVPRSQISGSPAVKQLFLWYLDVTQSTAGLNTQELFLVPRAWTSVFDHAGNNTRLSKSICDLLFKIPHVVWIISPIPLDAYSTNKTPR